jgi:hypothetical protein
MKGLQSFGYFMVSLGLTLNPLKSHHGSSKYFAVCDNQDIGFLIL